MEELANKVFLSCIEWLQIFDEASDRIISFVWPQKIMRVTISNRLDCLNILSKLF